MEYQNGESWRNLVKDRFSKIGITCFDPYNKPFLFSFDESPEFHVKLTNMRLEERYDELSILCREFRSFDLNLVDRSDFIIFYLNPKVHTCGSYEEFFTANRAKKQIFLVVEGGKKCTPYWIFGTINHENIYNNLEELFEKIEGIDSGKIEIDNTRWRLLKNQYR